MPTLVYKGTCAVSYILSNKETITLRGYGFIDNVNDKLWELAIKEYPILHKQMEEGYITISNTKTKHSDEALSDAMGISKKKQEEAIDNNQKTNNVDIVEGRELETSKKKKWPWR